ncbi:MAG: type II toxin-antitoxin system VapB family antitoxin [Symbiobacteriaceae bacterium]|nr:type II toxin-antitoxin system VapB family antitoxin [Symbiobacteriaceae bacterium]
MQTAKIFQNGKSQAVRLPKEFRFNCTEVSIQRVGQMICLIEKDKAWDNFFNTEPATDDFVEAVLAARNNPMTDSPRVPL